MAHFTHMPDKTFSFDDLFLESKKTFYPSICSAFVETTYLINFKLDHFIYALDLLQVPLEKRSEHAKECWLENILAALFCRAA